METDKTAIRDAATMVVLRDAATAPRILMGQRGSSASFMPNKVVFPGGAVDAVDMAVPLAMPLADRCSTRLAHRSEAAIGRGLLAAGIREVWEETGLILGTPGSWDDPAPRGWRGFAETGHLPSAEGMHFIFRAVTPLGNTRRFDARFFLVDAAHLASDPDDFSRAEDELSHLQWVPLDQVRSFDLPFITEIVLAEVADLLDQGLPPPKVPFFDNLGSASRFVRID